MPPRSLPVELLVAIFDFLPPADFDEEPYRARQHTLRSLCLVSTRFRNLVQPLLRHTVRLKNDRQIAALKSSTRRTDVDMAVKTIAVDYELQETATAKQLVELLRHFPLVETLHVQGDILKEDEIPLRGLCTLPSASSFPLFPTPSVQNRFFSAPRFPTFITRGNVVDYTRLPVPLPYLPHPQRRLLQLSPSLSLPHLANDPLLSRPLPHRPRRF
jgi:hypothetical protein